MPLVVELPTGDEAAIRAQAAAAGFVDIGAYVLDLIEQDQEARKLERSLGQDGRLEDLALAGVESGPAVPLDMFTLRRELHARH